MRTSEPNSGDKVQKQSECAEMSLSELKVIDIGSTPNSIQMRSPSPSLPSSSTLSMSKDVIRKVSLRSSLPPKIPVKNGNTKTIRNPCPSSSTRTPLRSIIPATSFTRSPIVANDNGCTLLKPRRIFPSTKSIDLVELELLDHAKTVFDGKLSFDLGCAKQSVRQEFRPSPAHISETETASRYLSEKIRDFLKRTDHVMEEWMRQCKTTSKSNHHCDMMSMIEEQRNGRNDPLARSKSVANIMIKSYQMSKNMPPTERSNSMSRVAMDPLQGDQDDDTISIVTDEVDRFHLWWHFDLFFFFFSLLHH